MLRCSGRRLRQTANPPRRCTPLEENPLMRWSYLLRPWQLASQPLSHSSRPSFVLASATPHIPVSDPCDTLSTRSLILAKSRYCQADTLSHVCVGLEGCRNAFNATCAIRTCQFFGTGQPPRFLSLQGWGDIAHLQRRSLPGHAEVASAANSCTPATTSTEVQVSTTKDTSANARTLPGHDSRREENSASKEACKSCSAGGARVSKVAEPQRQTSTLALFGECDFLSPVPTATSIRDASSGEGIVLVALENFTPRSRSIHRCRVPCRAHEVRLIVGDENAGVRACLTAGHDGDTHDLADLLAPTATATSTTATTTAEAIRTTEKTQQKDACVMNTETTRTHHQTIFPAVPKTRCASSSHHSWAVALTNTDSHCSATDSDIATDEGSDEMSHAKECHGSAHVVLYIPQYGTISSLNVVTALGIGLFYAYLDAHHPHARTLVDESNTLSDASSSLRSMLANTMTRLRQYQRRFEHSLPRLPSPTRCGIVSSSASSRRRDGWSYSAAWEEDKDEETRRSLLAIHAGTRPDHRPIHPCYYRMSGKEIRDGHREYRRDLLRLSDMYTRLSLSCQKGARDRPPLHRFGLSALYENDYDQRNFGGLVRNANAFLVDCVCYVGRRRYNVVGAVGSYHYTPPIYIPYRCNDTPSSANEDARRHVTSHTNNRDSNSSNMDCDEEEDDAADSSTDAYRLVRNAQADSRISSDALRCDVEQACGGSCRWWLLDCGQSALYHTSSSSSSSIDSTASTAHCSSVESMRWYREQCARGDGVMSLCDDEYTLRAAIRGCGLLLVVPQEGKLPSMNILQHCEKILTVAPRQSVALDHDGDANSASMRTAAVGLPQQVASGIAFQRLSTIMHPCVKTL